MTPIVHGLEEEFRANIEFLYMNAADGAEGQRTFQSLRLPGHPSYVLFGSDGKEIYRGFGLVEAETFRNEIRASLSP
jgi:hypothetical protein